MTQRGMQDVHRVSYSMRLNRLDPNGMCLTAASRLLPDDSANEILGHSNGEGPTRKSRPPPFLSPTFLSLDIFCGISLFICCSMPIRCCDVGKDRTSKEKTQKWRLLVRPDLIYAYLVYVRLPYDHRFLQTRS